MITPTLAETDRALTEWSARLQRIDDNLVAIESEPTYAMLASSAAHADLAGRTKDVALPAVKAIAELFEQRGRLADIVERAKAIRADVGFFGAEEKLREIHALLTGPSIALGHLSPSLAQRSLLGASSAELTATPDQLLGQMVTAFDTAKRVIAEVSRAWGDIEPRLVATETELTNIRASAASLGEAAHVLGRELTEAEAELALVRRDVTRDPLGAADRDQVLTARVTSLRSALTASLEARDFVVHGLAKAAEEIASIDRLDRAADAAHAAARGEFRDVDGHLSPRIDRRLLDDLVSWRTTLQGTANAGRWRAAYIGVQRWLDTARTLHAAASAAVSSAQAFATRREELQGRVSARRAQLQALARRGVQIPTAAETQAKEADHALATKPVSLPHAEQAVRTFEATVIALSGHG